MSLATLEHPQVETLPAIQPQTMELPGSYQDILNADNPKLAIEQFDSNPEQLSTILLSLEQEVGVAGAELGTSRQTDEHVATFVDKKTSYQSFLELVVTHKVEKMVSEGSTEEEIDQTIVETLVESRRSVLHADLEHRLDSSFVENAMEKVAKSKTRRVIGAIACAAAGVVTLYGTQKGLNLAGESIGAGGDEAAVIGTFAGLELAKLGYSQVTSKLKKGINKYRPVPKHGSDMTDENSSLSKDQERKIVEDQVIDLKKELFLITATHHESKGISKDTLSLVLEKFGSTMNELYGLKEHKESTKEIAELGSIVLAAALVDEYADSGTIADLVNTIKN